MIRSGPEKSYLILFERPATKPEKGDAHHAQAGTEETKGGDQEVSCLRDELARTREYVQAIIRDQEATNEKLRTANEDALSSMEELQRTTRSWKPRKKSFSPAMRS